jgi:hypothetical protein
MFISKVKKITKKAYIILELVLLVPSKVVYISNN